MEYMLAENLDIRHVEKMQVDFLDLLLVKEDIILNAEKVKHTDTAGLQLVISLLKQFKIDGIVYSWKNPSHSFITAVKDLGMIDALNLDEYGTKDG